jgi:O-antigen/teichoic acid export membrane protein
MAALRRSILFSAIDRLGTAAVNVVTMAVVARLLTPGEVGVFVFGATVALIVQTLRDSGIGMYLIQEREITREGVQTTFTITFIASLILSIALYISSAAIAVFYSDGRLEPIVRIAAYGVLIASIGNVPVALIRRDMQFGKIAAINLIGAGINLMTAVGLAVLGYGYLSLPWAMFASLLAMMIVAIWIRPMPWMFQFNLKHWRRVLLFGVYSSATAILSNFLTMMPQLIIGRILGFEAVGIFGRAAFVAQLPDRTVLGAVAPIVLPALAAQVRDGGDLKSSYLQGIAITSALYLPIMLCMAILSFPLVLLLLGRQWMSAAPLVRIICGASLCMFAATLNTPVLVAKGRVEDTVTILLIALPVTAAVVSVGAFYGLTAIAATTFITGSAQCTMSFWFIQRQIPIRWAEFIHSLQKSVIVAISSGIAPGVFVVVFGSQLPLLIAFVAAICAAVGWLLGLVITGHPLLPHLKNIVTFSRAKTRFRH